MATMKTVQRLPTPFRLVLATEREPAYRKPC